MTWNANRTITYKQNRWWYFDQENSNGTLDDVVTTLNVVTLVCLSLILLHHGAACIMPLASKGTFFIALKTHDR